MDRLRRQTLELEFYEPCCCAVPGLGGVVLHHGGALISLLHGAPLRPTEGGGRIGA